MGGHYTAIWRTVFKDQVPMLETTVTGDQRAGSDGHMVKDVMLMFNCQVVSNSFVSPGTVVCQASLSVGFPRQEYWSELPFPSPENLPDPGMGPAAPILAGRFLTTELPASVCVYIQCQPPSTLRLFHGKVLVTVDWVTSLLTVQSHYYGEQ